MPPLLDVPRRPGPWEHRHLLFQTAAAYAALKPDAVILKSKARNWVIALFVVNALLTVQNAQVSVGGAAHALGIIVGLAIGYAIRKRNKGRHRRQLRLWPHSRTKE